MDDYGADLFGEELEADRERFAAAGFREEVQRPGWWRHASGEVVSEAELRRRLARGEGGAR